MDFPPNGFSPEFFIFFTLIGLQGLLVWAYAKEERPWYGLVFFFGVLSHQLADFINCRWQPFGPWDSAIEWGLYINFLLKLIMEEPFHIIAVLIVVYGLIQLRAYKKK